jgi:large repetitive protein
MSFRSLLDILKARPQRTRRAPAWPRACPLAVESLEDRRTPAAVLSVGDVTLAEGNDGTHNALVQVTVSEPHGNSVTVNYNTADGSARSGSDYNAASGTLTFNRNETAKSILIPIRGDRLPEQDKTFFVRLANAKGAKVADGEGVVTIVDDEPRVSVDDVSMAEGNSGTASARFTVRLSAAYDVPVTVAFATTDGSASAGSDYAAAAGTVTFLPGQTIRTITVAVNGDRLGEADETFFVNLSTSDAYAGISKAVGVGTIADDEPRVSIGDAYNYGESTLTFTVSLSGAYDQVVQVGFATADGTASAGVDYGAASGTLTFGIGQTSQTIMVDVLDPTSVPDKYFSVQLSGASTNALLANSSAYGYWYYDYGDYYF